MLYLFYGNSSYLLLPSSYTAPALSPSVTTGLLSTSVSLFKGHCFNHDTKGMAFY